MTREMTRQKMCSKTGCVKSQKGTEIIEKRTFLNDETDTSAINKNMKGSEILKSEVKLTLAKLNRNKVTRPDGVVIEMFAALDDISIDKITNIQQ